MGWYERQVVPRVVDLTLRNAECARIRARVTAGLDGEVLEIGFGSGLNVPHYPPTLSRVVAVDPATTGRKLAAQRISRSPVPVKFAGLDAGALPAEDGSVDYVLSTWTLCTVPDPALALAEIRRVLRPGGSLRFAEHGLSPDRRVGRWQDRMTPVQRRVFAGCHLNRPMDKLIKAAGFDLTSLDTYYMTGPRFLGYTFEGVAIRP